MHNNWFMFVTLMVTTYKIKNTAFPTLKIPPQVWYEGVMEVKQGR